MMSIAVFYTLLTGRISAARYEEHLQAFPAPIREKISRYTLMSDRQLRIAGKCLLLKALKHLDIYPAFSLDDYRQEPGQRPSLAGTDIHFSIAHSGDLVLCAVSREQRIGIDVEQVRPFRADLMSSYFDPASWLEITRSADSTAAFYQHWTRREAALKASGQGIMQTALPDMLIKEDQVCFGAEKYSTRFLPVHDDYVVCIAAEKKITGTDLQPLAEETLFSL